MPEINDRLAAVLEKKGPIRRIGVVGMGYVGIPAAVLFAGSPAFDFVYGFQRDSRSSGYKIDTLNRGESPFKGDEPGLEEMIEKVVSAGRFRCTSDFSRISGLDAVTLSIQTPFKDPKDLLPDFNALEEGLRQVGANMSEGTLVVLESTVTPGTTAGMAMAILEEESGMKAGEDFALAHAPERIMVGRLLRNIREHDRIVGGIDEASTKRAIELYSPVLTKGKVIPMSAMAAEVTKTAENTFRDLQIAAANQREGASVRVHDPYVTGYPGVDIQHDIDLVLRDADALATLTGHEIYTKLTPRGVIRSMGSGHPVIVDGRNVIDPDPFIARGFVYKGIGRGDKNDHAITRDPVAGHGP